MPAYVNIPDVLKIGIIALLFIYLFNLALNSLGLDSFKASL